jgi:hypothetical protein
MLIVMSNDSWLFDQGIPAFASFILWMIDLPIFSVEINYEIGCGDLNE